MVPHPRAALRPHRLRPLNRPHPVRVACDAKGFPASITSRGRTRRVIKIKDRWRIDDGWWREVLSRFYYVVECADGCVETIYRDLVTDGWYRQGGTYVR